MRLRVDLCTAFVKVAELEVGEFEATVNNLAAGSFVASSPVAALGDVVAESVDTVLVIDEDAVPARVVFAGLVRRPDGSDGGVTREVDPAGSLVTWRGIDLWGALACRLVWPDPASVPPWSVSHDTRTDVASTVVAGLIADNIGVSALSGRSITNLSVLDPVVGAVGTWSFRLLRLSDAVAQVCREAGIGCIADMPTHGVPRFSVRSYDDHSARVVLSDQGDLERLTKVTVPASASFVLAAGDGELTDRKFATASSGAEGIERVEWFYDNTNITTDSALLRAAGAQLALGVEDVKVDGQVAEGAAQSLVWGTDYELGDTLGVEVDGVRRTAQVEQVRIEVSPIRHVVRPVLGRSSSSEVQRVIRAVDGLERRFDRNAQ